MARPAPAAAGRRLLGYLPEVQRDKLGLLSRLFEQCGPVVQFRMGPRWIHVIADPIVARAVLFEHRDRYEKGIGQDFARSFLGDGLLTSEGAAWEEHRAVIQPLFTAAERDAQLAIVREAVEEMLAYWREAGTDSIPVTEEMMRLTLCIAWRLVFGDQIGARDQRVRAILAVAFDDVGRRIVSPFAVPLSLPTPTNLRVRRALRDLEEIINDSIRRRPSQPNGMLTHLTTRFSGQPLAEQVRTLLFSAHETTAVALVWILDTAARAPGVWSTLAQEGREAVRSLSYANSVVHETLRLYPPVWVIPRTAIRDDVIDDILIPAGAIVVISPYLMHRDPAVWEEPELFKPERFGGGVPQHARQNYMPFGVGPRHCVGRGLAQAELIEVLTRIACSCRLSPSRPPPRPNALLTLRPPPDLKMTLKI
jgi:cytochrome P450